ncbi:MAG: hypothetical protein Q8R28_11425 [Dehalococcoidia bacterium]|nr:hypothetical protein [Dehalococcoidia bacterium]
MTIRASWSICPICGGAKDVEAGEPARRCDCLDLSLIVRAATKAGVPDAEILVFLKYANGKRVTPGLLGPYGFTSRNFMVRQGKVTVFGVDRVFRLPTKKGGNA